MVIFSPNSNVHSHTCGYQYPADSRICSTCISLSCSVLLQCLGALASVDSQLCFRSSGILLSPPGTLLTVSQPGSLVIWGHCTASLISSPSLRGHCTSVPEVQGHITAISYIFCCFTWKSKSSSGLLHLARNICYLNLRSACKWSLVCLFHQIMSLWQGDSLWVSILISAPLISTVLVFIKHLINVCWLWTSK